MAYTLKPEHLDKATSAADLQKKMKADLKGNLGRNNVKFVAAKNCVIGGKTVSLFIVTDNPLPFEAILKTKHPRAYRAKGACDLEKDTKTGATKVIITSSSGQMTADAVGRLIPLALAGDKSFQVTFPVAERAKLNEALQKTATLKKTSTNDRSGLSDWAKEEFRKEQLKKGIENPPTLRKVKPPVTGGVPAWAKRQYRRQAKRTLIASMTPNQKIGSIYFGKAGRIRLTHDAGPAKEGHGSQTTVQFNINDDLASDEFLIEFRKSNGTPTEETKDAYWKKFWEEFDPWLADRLVGNSVGGVPSWATAVTGPQDVSSSAPSKDIKLFEIFTGINNRVEGWHPSRGAATKFETDKQTISVLEAAIKHIDGRKLTDPNERNVAFYNFVKSRLPKFVPLMREPDKLDD